MAGRDERQYVKDLIQKITGFMPGSADNEVIDSMPRQQAQALLEYLQKGNIEVDQVGLFSAVAWAKKNPPTAAAAGAVPTGGVSATVTAEDKKAAFSKNTQKVVEAVQRLGVQDAQGTKVKFGDLRNDGKLKISVDNVNVAIRLAIKEGSLKSDNANLRENGQDDGVWLRLVA